MLIIGYDFHPSFQMVSILDKKTGEVRQMRLGHREEAERFYRSLRPPVRVGMEACGQWIWFERLLAELGHELWLGDAGQIRAMVVRRQKTDRRDADHILSLLLQERFPRLWVPSLEERDARHPLLHRHKQVQARTRVRRAVMQVSPGHSVVVVTRPSPCVGSLPPRRAGSFERANHGRTLGPKR